MLHNRPLSPYPLIPFIYCRRLIKKKLIATLLLLVISLLGILGVQHMQHQANLKAIHQKAEEALSKIHGNRPQGNRIYSQ